MFQYYVLQSLAFLRGRGGEFDAKVVALYPADFCPDETQRGFTILKIEKQSESDTDRERIRAEDFAASFGQFTHNPFSAGDL